MKAIAVVNESDRRKHRRKFLVQPVRREEVFLFKPGYQLWMYAGEGTVRKVRISSHPKSFKRDPERVEVSVVFGMLPHGFSTRFTRFEVIARNLFLPVWCGCCYDNEASADPIIEEPAPRSETLYFCSPLCHERWENDIVTAAEMAAER